MMSQKDPLALYHQYYVERDFERLDLFQLLAEKYHIQSVLYPGSFVHITPSLVYPTSVYVDNDKQAKKFFASVAPMNFIAQHKQYPQQASMTFHGMSYTQDFGEADEGFDLLISQYAGFVSQHCKRYLKIGGVLLANNSHGDASMASIDEQFELVAVANRRDNIHRIRDNDLESYFVPKSGKAVTRQYVEQIQRGVGYKKSASMYIFRRVI